MNFLFSILVLKLLATCSTYHMLLSELTLDKRGVGKMYRLNKSLKILRSRYSSLSDSSISLTLSVNSSLSEAHHTASSSLPSIAFEMDIILKLFATISSAMEFHADTIHSHICGSEGFFKRQIRKY
ncbi:hypothetical protein C0J52_00168 [Blattella germanica]|nr:hypothetical protein C0J52_00168 [Blattella germanica]